MQCVRHLAQHERGRAAEEDAALAGRQLADHPLGGVAVRVLVDDLVLEDRARAEGQAGRGEDPHEAVEHAAGRLVVGDRLVERDGEPARDLVRDRTVHEGHAETLR